MARKPPSQRPERQRPENTLLIFPVEVGFSDELLIDAMHQMRDARERESAREKLIIAVSISGYDSDPRELGEIPEVRDFCARLVRLGFIADMEPSMLFRLRDEGRPVTSGIPFGAMEIWLSSQGKHKGERFEFTSDDVEEFRKRVLPQANRAADAVLVRPWPPQNAANN
jgi:hypothetical protein